MAAAGSVSLADEGAAAKPSAESGCWDPMASPDWDAEKHTREAIHRIKGDLDSIYKDPPQGICVIPDNENISVVHALVIGPSDTPYEGGLFHFFVRFPPNYPFAPPRVKLLTTGGGTVRFNPNLYKSGKVCLSILGTWPGPAWTAAQSLLSVLVSIQSLMNERPYHNEPGFDQAQNRGDSEKYNNIIAHETLRVAVCGALESSQGPPGLQEVRREMFHGFADHYITTAREMAAKLDGQPMMDPFNVNRGTFNFSILASKLQALLSSLSCHDSNA